MIPTQEVQVREVGMIKRVDPNDKAFERVYIKHFQGWCYDFSGS